MSVADDPLGIDEDAAGLLHRTEDLLAQTNHLVRTVVAAGENGERDLVFGLPRGDFSPPRTSRIETMGATFLQVA